MIRVHDRMELCKKLGYHNMGTCLKKIDHLEQNGIENFLCKEFEYDFVLGKEFFLKKVIELYGSEKDMEIFKNWTEKVHKKPGHLFVNTGLIKTSQPVFALAALEKMKNIPIHRRVFKDKNEEIEYVRFYVKRHYRENDLLKPWGKIINYIYKSDCFEKYLILDKNGNIVGKMENFDIQKATDINKGD